jgi:hypothetical protein
LHEAVHVTVRRLWFEFVNTSISSLYNITLREDHFSQSAISKCISTNDLGSVAYILRTLYDAIQPHDYQRGRGNPMPTYVH